MALQEIRHIDGLENEYEDVDTPNDVHPGATLVKFYVKSIDMPYLSKQAGKIIRHNVVYFNAIINLGNLIIDEPIRDNVYFNEEEGKWKIKMLANGQESWIKKYPDQWNSFVRGSVESYFGTPLSFLFKNDLAKVDAYKGKHVHTIEQLEACSEVHFQELGFGSKADQEKAHKYLEHIKSQAPSLELNNRFEEKDSQIKALEKTNDELAAKLTEVLTAMQEKKHGDDNEKIKTTKKKPGRPAKVKPENVEHIEGLEE